MPDLPKFLMADDLDSDRAFVVHTQTPRFIAEVKLQHGLTVLDPQWIDEAWPAINETLNALMHAASAFYQRSQRPGADSRN